MDVTVWTLLTIQVSRLRSAGSSSSIPTHPVYFGKLFSVIMLVGTVETFCPYLFRKLEDAIKQELVSWEFFSFRAASKSLQWCGIWGSSIVATQSLSLGTAILKLLLLPLLLLLLVLIIIIWEHIVWWTSFRDVASLLLRYFIPLCC